MEQILELANPSSPNNWTPTNVSSLKAWIDMLVVVQLAGDLGFGTLKQYTIQFYNRTKKFNSNVGLCTRFLTICD